MSILPKELKFKYPWRSYQERVLKELEHHLCDSKLHIIAPPGSGKTVLGLEVVRRLDKPTLIISPTITIREQWIDRLNELFLENRPRNNRWLSRNLRSPALITCTTYQALHKQLLGIKNEPNEIDLDYNDNVIANDNCLKISIGDPDKLVASLNKLNIKVIVVDEAHHLRNEWWKSLIYLSNSLDKVKIVALTATPPYDVSSFEWKRYEEFCGPIDAEISVPELIANGDLCPHQDYVYFSTPSISENETIRKHYTNVKQFFDNLTHDNQFIDCISAHPFIQNPNQHIEQILDEPQYFSSILIFLNHVHQDITNKHFRVLGIKEKDIPDLTLEWLEYFLSGLIFNDKIFYEQHKDILDLIRKQLRIIGAFEHKRIKLAANSTVDRLLMNSISKLDSMLEIVKKERDFLNEKLRMVILTDYIRESYLPNSKDDLQILDKVGIATIFEYIRRNLKENIRLGVLSGTIVIIPRKSLNSFKKIAIKEKIPSRSIQIKILEADTNYIQIDIKGEKKQRLVRTITELFKSGQITVLIGTKSLLGEGWDSPSINSLILASFVGSYMLSNQMRGRAIRSQMENPDKVSNIWHIVCVDDSAIPGYDYEMLQRRFSAFVGVAHHENIIKKGISRIGLGDPPFTSQKIGTINNTMFLQASQRDKLLERWKDSLKTGRSQVDEVFTPKENTPRYLVVHKTIHSLFAQGIGIGSFVFSWFADLTRSVRDYKVIIRIIGVGLLISALAAMPKCARSLWLLIKHGPIESSIREIAEVLLKTLIKMNHIKTDIANLKIVTRLDKSGSLYCTLEGGSYFEQSLFRVSLKEILDPVNNPRFIIVRYSLFFGITRQDYHSVPSIIGQKKIYSEYFSRQWNEKLGFHRLIYARNLDGRKILIKARFKSLASAFQKKSEIVSIWR